MKTYGLKIKNTYAKIFERNTEAELVNAVKRGMNVYHRIYDKYGGYETFFEAAVRYGTPELVHACVDMGADVNCTSPIKAKYTAPRAMTSSLCAAMEAYNPATLRALLERGARIGVLNNLRWSVQRNVFPEAENDEEARAIKRRLDAGAEILKILQGAGFTLPGLEGTDGLSFYSIQSDGRYCLDSVSAEEVAGERYTAWGDWEGIYADGCDSVRGWDEVEMKFSPKSPGNPMPMHGTRPGALWHAASPEALRLMIEAGADVNMRDAAGLTAMHYIVCHRDSGYYYRPLDMLRVLLENGAELDARTSCGVTPLMLAAHNIEPTYDWDNADLIDDWEMEAYNFRSVETCNFLLERGADFRAVDDRGRGVWSWAAYYWSPGRFGGDLDRFIHQRVLLELCRFVLQ